MATPNRAQIEISAVDKTKKALSSVNAGLKGVTSALFSVKGAIAGAVGVAGMGALVKSSLSATDALAKTADKLGLTTEALAGMRHAADLTGVSQQQLDKGLQRLTRRTSEAAKGIGVAGAAYEELGISIDHVAALSPDEQFREISKAMEDVDSAADRLRLTTALVGSESAGLVNTLSAGTSALDAAAAEADRFGLSLSRIDAAQVEAANDAMGNVKKAIQGAATQVSAQLAPALRIAAEEITELIVGTVDWAAVTEKFVNFAVKGFIRVKQAVDFIGVGVNHVHILIAKMLEGLTTGITVLIEKSAQLARFLKLEGVAESFDAISESVAMTSQHYADFGAHLVEKNEELRENLTVFTEEWEEWERRKRIAVQQTADTFIAANDSMVVSTTATAKQQAAMAAWLARAEKVRLKEREQAQQAYVGAMNTVGDALFKENKAVQIGMAIVNTAAGVTQALASLPYPANLAAAASVAIAGAAQIATIKSASKGSGSGSPSAPAGAPPATPLPIGPESGEDGAGGVSRNVSISLLGSSFSKSDIRDLIDSINEELGDGASLSAA